MRKEVDDLSSSHFSSSELSDRSTPDGFVSPRQTGKIGRLNSQRRANSIHLTLNTLRFEQGVLYGRETEIETLKKSFQNQHSVVLIAGASGIGKTSLALQLQRPVKKAGGVFVSGKYDFSQRTHPFTGIKQACRMLSEHLLLSQPSDERLSHLRETLSGMIHIVAEIVPGILNVVGIDSEGDSFDEIGVRESRNRFRFALKAFLQVLVSWSPLVMLLDDLQWADAESLELLESLVNDPQLKGMTLVGCYRSNEVDDAHLLAKWVRNIEALESVDTTRINLSSLTASAVSQMIAGILSVDLPRTKGMAKVVTRKTLGNPFFVIQFLKALHERGILDYNLGLLEWTWNDDDIESKMLPTENVADLVKAKMSALAESMREVLPLAACLGSTFTECSLEIVMKAFLKNATISPPCRESEELIVARNWLDFCAKEGLIERSDPEGGRYRWVHDKIQEAAMDLVEAPDELSFLRYRMGCILLRSLDEDELNKMIFIVTNLLNEDIGSCWTTGDLPFEIAEMNLRAGKKAIAFASFEQAAVYLQRGIEWLPGDHWIERYELSLELYSSAAEALYALGGASPMEFYCNEVIRQDRPLLDKMRAYHVLIDALGNKLLLTKTIDMIVSVLSQLGCHFPKRGLLLYVLCGLLRVKITTRKLTVEKLSQLKEMDDRSKMEAMRLLDKLATFTFIAKSDLLPLAILKSFRWSLEFGICCNSPPAFATVGLILSTALGVSA